MLFGQPIYIAPSLQKVDPATTHRVLLVLSFLYSISALLAAYGAWRRSNWCRSVYAVFAGTATAFLLFFFYIAPIPKDALSFIGGPIFLGLLGWGLWKGWHVISAELNKVQRVA